MPDAPNDQPQRLSWVAQLRTYLLTGVVVAGPLAITVYLARGFLDWVDATVKPLIPVAWNPDQYLPFAVPGFGLFVALVLLTLLGALTASLVGRSLISYGEQLIDRTPFVRPVYKTLKQIFETVIANRETTFKQVGLIEWPRKGLWSIVFLSTTARGEIADKLVAGNPKLANQDIVTVFIPTTPNPTGGYIMFVPRRDLILLDMSVEDAAKLIISGGLVVPPERSRADRPAVADAAEPDAVAMAESPGALPGNAIRPQPALVALSADNDD